VGEFARSMAKHGAQFGAGVALLKIGKELREEKRRMKEEEKNPTEPVMDPMAFSEPHEFNMPESSLILTRDVITSLMGTILRNGVVPDDRVMHEAQKILNNIQELLDFKQKYYAQKGIN